MSLSFNPPGAAPFPDWIDRYPSEDGVALISPNRPYSFAESEYDAYYAADPVDELSGRGLVGLIRHYGGDFGGPVLELGCGSGKMTLGLCRTRAFPHVLVTDGSLAFLDLTRDKLAAQGIDVGGVRFATLVDADMTRLPPRSLSAVVMRSTLHHFLDVPRFIADTAEALRPGGALIVQEPCAGGYLLMGLLAALLTGELGRGLDARQRTKAGVMAKAMADYHRADVDKTGWEDKHIFRPEQMQAWAQAAGLVTHYYSNHEFEDFANERVVMDRIRFDKFMEDYMNYCMGFGAADAAALMEPLRPSTAFLAGACGGTREPQLMGIFVLQRPAGAGSA